MSEKKATKRVAPRGLSDKAARLWHGVTDGFTLRDDEYELLEAACREIDLIARMQREIDQDGVMTTGSMGQPVAHPLLGEVRQHRVVLKGLLAALKIPEDEVAGHDSGMISAQARKAAMTRWGQAHGTG